ncbi:MAG: hypothetical protein QOD93_7054 [Acetobacteraceae bacterium]|jgi:hypothetical protein|nr:hypothetical protein [Rhodopila sp.]MEA2774092.1 hypothetical protein [Acetobacteraceae bacterium]
MMRDTSPTIPVSWGELLDKIAILEIKTHRLRAPDARTNAANELRLLRQAAAFPQRAPELEAALRAVNTRLWRIEDLIREKEAAGDFGPGFIALARAVYHENDERGRIKQALNRLLRSALVEEKQYSPYEAGIVPAGPPPARNDGIVPNEP